MCPRGFTLLSRDADLIAVDKAAGIPVLRARLEDGPDLLTQLAEELGLVAGDLAVHQRLDRDTSGVMVLACSARGNELLQHAFSTREDIHKEYVAVLERRIPLGLLRHQLVHEDGVSRCFEATQDARAVLALSEVLAVEPLSGDASRFLARIRIHTGRTHQIRAQLAHLGAPIVGDRLYGGARHARLLLHAERLLLCDMRGKKLTEFRAPIPTVFFRPATLPEALRHAFLRRSFLARAQTNAYRLLHESETTDEHIAIDDYGGHWVLHNYDDSTERGAAWAQSVWHEAQTWDAALRPRSLFLKHRPKVAHRLSPSERAQLVAEKPLFGTCPDVVLVRENGLVYRIRPADGLSAGLFLDQRDNRAWFAEHARGQCVLNLFSYTCGFSLAAWHGGAASVSSVDMSKRLLAWGAENFAENPARPIDQEAVRFVHEDVFAFLQRAAKRKQTFDRIVVDPPTFATTKTSRFASGKDWQELFAAVLAVAADRAWILATSNDRRMHQGEFRAHIRKALNGRAARLLDAREPRDFPSAGWFLPHLKALKVELL